MDLCSGSHLLKIANAVASGAAQAGRNKSDGLIGFYVRQEHCKSAIITSAAENEGNREQTVMVRSEFIFKVNFAHFKNIYIGSTATASTCSVVSKI